VLLTVNYESLRCSGLQLKFPNHGHISGRKSWLNPPVGWHMAQDLYKIGGQKIFMEFSDNRTNHNFAIPIQIQMEPAGFCFEYLPLGSAVYFPSYNNHLYYSIARFMFLQ
jgi:hypothetical protein